MNFELTQKILMLGDSVQVLAPDALVQEIRLVLERAWKRYSSAPPPPPAPPWGAGLVTMHA